jgi:hypothetical protein
MCKGGPGQNQWPKKGLHLTNTCMEKEHFINIGGRNVYKRGKLKEKRKLKYREKVDGGTGFP